MLSREAILAARDLETVVIEVPEWGGSVTLRGMSGVDRTHFERSILKNETIDIENVYAKLLVRCIVDEAGNRMFTDADADALGAKSAVVLGRLAPVAQRLSGLLQSDVEELKKTSGATVI
jgi:hypothetical protein